MGLCYPQSWCTEVCSVSSFYVSSALSAIVVCSFCLQHISHGKSTSRLGNTCMKRHMTLHHKSQWKQHPMEQFNKRPALFLIVPHFQNLPCPPKILRLHLLQHLWIVVTGSTVLQEVQFRILQFKHGKSLWG